MQLPAGRGVPFILAIVAGTPLVLAACSNTASLDVPDPVFVEVPAAAGAALPHVHGSDAGLLLSWVEPADSGHALRFASFSGGSFAQPRTVAQGRDWFVNWADFPSVIAVGPDHLAAHWLQRSGAGTYAYDVMISQSRDGGGTWSPPVPPHNDGTQTEHGFVSLFPHDGGLGAVWLDGRQFVAEGHDPSNEMMVRFTTISDVPAPDVEIDTRACDCCQTGVAHTSRGPLLVYRDRSPGEVRDIAAARYEDGAWSEPRMVHNDNWVIDACPVNGPQVDADGARVVVAWFTAAQDSPRVNLAFSTDAGDSFTAPLRVDDGNALGRVDVALLDDSRALVVWLERTEGSADVRARIVDMSGRPGASRVIAQTAAQRPSGFPRLGRHGDTVLLAWTQPGDSSRVLAAALQFAR